MATKTIEQKVAETILQQPYDIVVGDKTYTASSPSTATLILVSEAISKLPHIVLDPNNLVEESLSIAKDCSVLGDVVAILILGAKNIKETVKRREVKEKRFLHGLIRRKYEIEKEIVVDRKAELANELLEELTPSELHSLTASLLQRMDLSDFFGLTTFLTEINLLQQTKVVNEATASGQ